MKAAVAASAPWMFDAQEVEQRVAEWRSGGLPGGDALFFRRYHIRPLWHGGVSVFDFGAERAQAGLDSDGHRHDFFPQSVRVDLVDAAGVSFTLNIQCSVQPNVGRSRQRQLHVKVSHGSIMGHLLYAYTPSHNDSSADPSSPYTRISLNYTANIFTGPPERHRNNALSDYLCHGHLHGLSEQQWNEAIGGLNIDYYAAHSAIAQLERKDDEQAVALKEAMFPTLLADVVDLESYRRLQAAEIRRMAAIAIRLALLGEGVDAAIFPCFQPAEMRQKFEAAARSARETGVAELPAALPAVLQDVVAG